MTSADNPFGTCLSCVWHSHDIGTDEDGDEWHYWLCWKDSGQPEKRMSTGTDKCPPACESHLKGDE